MAGNEQAAAKPRSAQIDLTQGDVKSGFFKFMWPIILGNIFTQIYNMVDSIVVGQFVVGKDDLNRKITAEERKLVRLREAYLCGAESAEEYRNEKARLTRRLEELRIRRETEEQKQIPLPSPAALQTAADRLDSPGTGTEDRFRAASAVLSSCVWDREKGTVTIIYRWRPE